MGSYMGDLSPVDDERIEMLESDLPALQYPLLDSATQVREELGSPISSPTTLAGLNSGRDYQKEQNVESWALSSWESRLPRVRHFFLYCLACDYLFTRKSRRYDSTVWSMTPNDYCHFKSLALKVGELWTMKGRDFVVQLAKSTNLANLPDQPSPKVISGSGMYDSPSREDSIDYIAWSVRRELLYPIRALGLDMDACLAHIYHFAASADQYQRGANTGAELTFEASRRKLEVEGSNMLPLLLNCASEDMAVSMRAEWQERNKRLRRDQPMDTGAGKMKHRFSRLFKRLSGGSTSSEQPRDRLSFGRPPSRPSKRVESGKQVDYGNLDKDLFE